MFSKSFIIEDSFSCSYRACIFLSMSYISNLPPMMVVFISFIIFPFLVPQNNKTFWNKFKLKNNEIINSIIRIEFFIITISNCHVHIITFELTTKPSELFSTWKFKSCFWNNFCFQSWPIVNNIVSCS